MRVVVGSKTPTYPDESGTTTSPRGGILYSNFMNFINLSADSLPAGKGRAGFTNPATPAT